MISLVELAERAQRSPKVDEKEWDLRLFKTYGELANKYKITGQYPGDDVFFNTDDDLADRAFEAAIEFLKENGIYCVSTKRVIRLTEDEIYDSLKGIPSKIIMGEGRDQRVWYQHDIESREPLNVCPGHHAPFDEEYGPLVVKNFAQIQRADFIEGFNFTSVDGKEIFGEPLETYAAIRELSWMREGVRKAGRPGMAIVLYPITTRVGPFLAPIDPEYGLRRTDGVLLSILPDVKIETDLLTVAIKLDDYGCFRVSGSFAMIGGFCGGLEGAIIEGIVKPIAASICYHSFINYVGVEHITSVSAQKRIIQPLVWGSSVVCQALIRNTNIPIMHWLIPTSGPGTYTHLMEIAFRAIQAPLNGQNLYAPRHSRPEMNRGQTPLEAEFMIEVSDAVIDSRFTREEANEILKPLTDELLKLELERGKHIQETYDLVTHKPKEEFAKIYERVKERLREVGLSI
jgi:methylamine--corrinoid protein Co-methyltransferase